MWAQPFALFLQQPDHLLKWRNRLFFNFALKLWNSCHKNKKLYMKPQGQITHWFQAFSIELLCFGARRWGQIMVSYLYLNFLIFVSLRKTLIIEMFNESWVFFHKSNFWNRKLQDGIVTEFKSEFYMLFFYLMKNTNLRIQFVFSDKRISYNSSFHTPVTYLNTGKYSLWQRLI